MRFWVCLVVIAMLMILAPFQPSTANGGPVKWTETTAHSGITPKQENDVQLVRERLEIRLLNDFNRYAVRARYQLANPHAPRAVRYGVPINWSKKMALAQAAQGIRITLNGHAAESCKPAEFTKRMTPEESEGYQLENAAWCVVDLQIASGQNELTLEYTGELNYVDWETSKSALTGFGDRQLVYELWPAGYWHGPVEQLDLQIDFGPYAGLVKSLNLPGASPGSLQHMSASYRHADLRKLGSIEISFDGETPLHPRQLATWNRTASDYERRKVVATASSVLQPQGVARYDARNLVDGDPNTAWCAGRSKTGVGDWLEFHIAPAKQTEFECRLQGLVLIPGYARSDALYVNNNRIRKVRIANCETPKNFRDVTLLKPTRKANLAAVLIEFDSTSRLPVEEYRSDATTLNYRVSSEHSDVKDDSAATSNCYRVQILEIEPGTKYRDTCISEVAPVFNCG